MLVLSGWFFYCTVKPLNSGHLRVLKNLSVIKRCPLLASSLTKIVIYRTKHFVCYSRHVRYLGCPLLRGFTLERFLSGWLKYVFSRLLPTAGSYFNPFMTGAVIIWKPVH